MSIINKTLQKEIFAHAEREYPNECCGLIVKTETRKKYIPCTNVAEGNKQDEFVISPEEYADAEDMGEVLAVVHSHPDATSKPSARDKAVCSEMGIPWIIVSWPEGDLRVVVPEQFPLIGRPFVHGTRLDCYGLVRDYYKETYNISLACYDHDRYWWEDENDTSFYEEKHEEQGFYKVTDGSLQVGDLIIMTIRAKKPNHAAIYMGNNRILHHMFGKLSKYEVYGGYWEEHTSFILRHKDLHEGAK
jgi:proteasome lid subunit RPN8/RPN11